jgi:hypothetical protein
LYVGTEGLGKRLVFARPVRQLNFASLIDELEHPQARRTDQIVTLNVQVRTGRSTGQIRDILIGHDGVVTGRRCSTVDRVNLESRKLSPAANGNVLNAVLTVTPDEAVTSIHVDTVWSETNRMVLQLIPAPMSLLQ